MTAGRFVSGVVLNPISKVMFVFQIKCEAEFYALPDNSNSDASASFEFCG